MKHAGEVRRQLEAARRDLLDLTLRNRMLNHRELAARGIEVDREDAVEVFERATGGARLSFLPLKNGSSGTDLVLFDPEIARLGQALLDKAKPARRTGLRTPYDAKRLYERLLGTYRAARTLLQEQGTSNLFLALGMLKWFESDDSETPRWAPLALLPVELERTGVKERFRLLATGDDLQANPSLKAKLTEYSVDLPLFDPQEDVDLVRYFTEVSDAVKGLDRWSVDTKRVALGFYSFSRYLMYLDLDEEAWPEPSRPSDHPIISALLGNGFSEPTSTVDDETRLDDQVPIDAVSLVMDADSTQLTTAIDVNRGRNLVVQGPPGTGKSQTITNIIADAVGRGQKVLFVSEKMAALDVVRRRLEHVGLGDAVLELHSNKARKKDVLSELERVLELGRPTRGDPDGAVQRLGDAFGGLNRYADAVNTPLPVSEVAPVDAFGHCVQEDAFLDGVASEVHLDGWESWTPEDLGHRRSSLARLAEWIDVHGSPSLHPFWGSTVVSTQPQHERAATERMDELAQAVSRLEALGRSIAKTLRDASVNTPKEAANLHRTLELLHRAPDWQASFASRTWESVDAQVLTKFLDAGQSRSVIHEELEERLLPYAWQAEVKDIHRELLAPRSFLERMFSPAFRRAVRGARRLLKPGVRAKAPELVTTLQAIRDAAADEAMLVSFETEAATLFGDSWEGLQSDFGLLRKSADWRLAVRRGLNDRSVFGNVLAWAESRAIDELSAPWQASLAAAVGAYRSARDGLTQVLELEEEQRFPGGGLPVRTFEDHERFIDGMRANLSAWRFMGQYQAGSKRATDLGLRAFVDFAAYHREGGRVLDVFDRWWFRHLGERALMSREELAAFDRTVHESRIASLRRLDAQLLSSNRATIAMRHYEGLPSDRQDEQVAVLLREFHRKRRHLPVRRLVEQAGDAMQAIKPVFMMSPISVAQYLPPARLEFDIVVFDEASQVRPADSLGALMRGRQAVVVGDSQQLPPTDFFESMLELDDEEGEASTADTESVLELFLAKAAPSRMLRWHYRSRHEALIAVSNQEFYDNRLLVFPSPASKEDGLGVVLHHDPETVYDRGRSRTNREEAHTVAQAVMRHARHQPELSLGVAAFSSAQATMIENEVERLRRENAALEAYFEDHQDEPFFVKNLETVQGDERDVIFISVGYGRDSDGRISMNFGPLNRDGGERRLNVLVTRAKRRCEIFSNIRADDIADDGSPARGVRALRAYLDYAASDERVPSATPVHEADRPFERAVGGALRERGYEVRHRIGVAGVHLDLAVVDGDVEGRYLLGIECDGETYHGARSARDRDRLRQEVLEGLGWNLHRIWSTDWFRDPTGELERTVRAIEAVKDGHRIAAPVVSAVEDAGSDLPADGDAVDRIPRAAPTPYIEAVVNAALHDGEALHEVDAPRMADWLAQIVHAEGPVHLLVATRRVLDAVSVARAGSRIRAAIERGLRFACEGGTIDQRGEFLWPSEPQDLVARDRSSLPKSLRKIELVPPEEIELAILQVVAAPRGLVRQAIVSSVAERLGLGPLDSDIREGIGDRIEVLEIRGEVEQRESRFVVRN